MTLAVAQEARRIDSSRWEWAVWLEGAVVELDEVIEVVYTLHPSFSQPIRVVSDRASKFRLASRGWGEFQLRARANIRAGGSVQLTHWLRLESDRTTPQQGMTVDIPSQANVFVSARVADEPFAEDLRQALQGQGFRTLGSSGVSVGSSWTDSLDKAVRDSNGLVMLVTGRITPWMEEEARLFTKQGKPVVPVLVNGATPDSPDLRELPALQVKLGPERSTEEVAQIAQRVQEILSEHR
jgi:TIR domain/YEATS family